MPARRGRRGRVGRPGDPQLNTSYPLPDCCDSCQKCAQICDDEDSFFRYPDTDDSFLCTWCKKEYPLILEASCGHQFCKRCVEDVVLPISACPIDKHFIRESRLAEFILLETQESLANESSDSSAIRALKSRVDSLTIVMNRLIEHLAIRTMLNESKATKNTILTNGFENIHPMQQEEPQKGPLISDFEDSEPEKPVRAGQAVDFGALDSACRAMNIAMLCNLPVESRLDPSQPTELVITSTNVRQLLPRFWKKATEENWSDEEKVQRLRMICDPALQRLLDNADVFRKDWAYISSILYGDHVLDEVSMIRCLGSARQRFGETPYQWYLRVCSIVERGLPPGPLQDWEVRSAFIRGLHPRYQQALGTGKLSSIREIIERCSQVDIFVGDPASGRGDQVNCRKTCYQCGNRGHVMRDCPQTKGSLDRMDPGQLTEFFTGCP
ncbi:hypothetical protein CSKR_108489 [Clonorchis sinensis]|uniref:CCHC-type domain-containing protein n=1 Tax=Clonorchis sinensis TaxID=79923 RepID=A0A8T1M225_CLOSI|nr:hypothetical protein CSKR_108489 [Clonorchis sinensis]